MCLAAAQQIQQRARGRAGGRYADRHRRGGRLEGPLALGGRLVATPRPATLDRRLSRLACRIARALVAFLKRQPARNGFRIGNMEQLLMTACRPIAAAQHFMAKRTVVPARTKVRKMHRQRLLVPLDGLAAVGGARAR